MRTLAPDLHLDSAGTGGWHVGKPPHPGAIAAGALRGYDISMLAARRFDSEDFRDFDMIVTMDAENLASVKRIQPQESVVPVTRLLDHAPETGVEDVPDPYYTGDFEPALDLIEAGCRGLLRDLGR